MEHLNIGMGGKKISKELREFINEIKEKLACLDEMVGDITEAANNTTDDQEALLLLKTKLDIIKDMEAVLTRLRNIWFDNKHRIDEHRRDLYLSRKKLERTINSLHNEVRLKNISDDEYYNLNYLIIDLIDQNKSNEIIVRAIYSYLGMKNVDQSVEDALKKFLK